MIDLTTNYLGMRLRNPLIASASPLTESIENILQLEEAGIAAIVLPSLFEEQLQVESETLDNDLSRGVDEFPEATSYLPNLTQYNLGPDGYLTLIREARRRTSIPIIASLNGSTPGGWVEYATMMEQAGANAIELNLYTVEADVNRTSVEVEGGYCELVERVKGAVRVPIAVKLSPFFSSMANMARRLSEAGADGLVLFNRFYQPDFDAETLEVMPRLELSRRSELLLRIRWAAILYGKVDASLAVTGGVYEAVDAVKCAMAGASAVMMTSALLANGIRHAHRVLEGLKQWIRDHEYSSFRQMIGCMSQGSVAHPGAFERGNYMKVLSSYSLLRR
ncbi:MAG TPA: dihydroorotate dehydrogenase-like protein [Candidatus Acidoferrales bacterium]|nr:dihydroorotate dehydrogenase-like protein [Candidatus Acidoferrales bacterium]